MWLVRWSSSQEVNQCTRFPVVFATGKAEESFLNCLCRYSMMWKSDEDVLRILWISVACRGVFFFFFFFKGPHLQHMEVSRLGVEFKLQPQPQPQQHRSEPHLRSMPQLCGHAGSLTHWVRPGIEPASSWTLCQVLNLLSHRRTPPMLNFIGGSSNQRVT